MEHYSLFTASVSSQTSYSRHMKLTAISPSARYQVVVCTCGTAGAIGSLLDGSEKSTGGQRFILSNIVILSFHVIHPRYPFYHLIHIRLLAIRLTFPCVTSYHMILSGLFLMIFIRINPPYIYPDFLQVCRVASPSPSTS